MGDGGELHQGREEQSLQPGTGGQGGLVTVAEAGLDEDTHSLCSPLPHPATQQKQTGYMNTRVLPHLWGWAQASSRCEVTLTHQVSTLCMFTVPVSSSLATANRLGSLLFMARASDSPLILIRASIR